MDFFHESTKWKMFYQKIKVRDPYVKNLENNSVFLLCLGFSTTSYNFKIHQLLFFNLVRKPRSIKSNFTFGAIFLFLQDQVTPMTMELRTHRTYDSLSTYYNKKVPLRENARGIPPAA